jgi:hypothetical protein
MDFITVAQKWWWLIIGPGVFVAGIALLYLRTQFATKAEFRAQSEHVNGALTDLREQIGGQTSVTNTRLQDLESATKHLPDKEAFHRLELQVEKQNGAIAALREMHVSISSGVTRIEDHLIKQGEKK